MFCAVFFIASSVVYYLKVSFSGLVTAAGDGGEKEVFFLLSIRLNKGRFILLRHSLCLPYNSLVSLSKINSETCTSDTL